MFFKLSGRLFCFKEEALNLSNLKLPKQFFVAGTDTEVGKTYVSVDLIHRLKGQGESVGVMKPVAAGSELIEGQRVNQDALELIKASQTRQKYQQVNPYLFDEPVSPHIPASRENQQVDLDQITEIYKEIESQYDRVLVEGAGGWLAPIGYSITMADIAIALDIPVVLVVGLKLGCLNHAQLTQESISQSGLQLAGWIANSLCENMLYEAENIQYLTQCIEAPLLTHISYKNI